MGKYVGKRYANSHSYEDFLSYVKSDDFNNKKILAHSGNPNVRRMQASYKADFLKGAEKAYAKNGGRKKYYDEKPFKEEAARLNAEAGKQEMERQQEQDSSNDLGSQTLARGETMLTGGDGVTLAENLKKRRTLLGA